MVIGHHLIFTLYGWWLPNEPRGSLSHEIRVEKIKSLGPLHYGRKVVQPSRADLMAFHAAARDLLAHDSPELTDDDILLVGKAIGEVVRCESYVCHACAVMPDHVHLMICRHADYAETMLEKLQEATRTALIEAGRRAVNHPVWGGPGWKVFLMRQADVARVVEYVRQNPMKARRQEQLWDFVTPYRGDRRKPAIPR